MIKILIYVSPKREDLLDEIADKRFLLIEKYTNNTLDSFYQNYKSVLSHASYLVIDLVSLTDGNDEVIKILNNIKKVYMDTKVIILVDSKSINEGNADLLRRIVDRGFYNLVTHLDDLENTIFGEKTKEEALEYQVSRPEIATKEDRQILEKEQEEKQEIKRREEIQKERQRLEERLDRRNVIKPNKAFQEHRPFISVAIAGVEKHIGATHLALQVVSFLTYVGYRTSYLESTEEKKIFSLRSIYPRETNINERRNLLQWKGLDLYSNFSVSEVMAYKYDFYVFDYGELTETNIDSFLTKDIRIIVGGTKAWEIHKLRDKLELIGIKNQVFFFLNFLIEEEESEILSIMGELNKFTYFSVYEPDPSKFKGNLRAFKNVFEKFIEQEEVVTVKPAEKTGFLKRFF